MRANSGGGAEKSFCPVATGQAATYVQNMKSIMRDDEAARQDGQTTWQT